MTKRRAKVVEMPDRQSMPPSIKVLLLYTAAKQSVRRSQSKRFGLRVLGIQLSTSSRCVRIFGCLILLFSLCTCNARADVSKVLKWEGLPSLPDRLGVAGPFAGVHNDVLLVAGGANFPEPVWENDKVWRDRIHVLTKQGEDFVWKDGGQLPTPVAYGTTVSTPDGIVCMGGNDSSQTFDEVFLLQWNPIPGSVSLIEFPSLPKPCAFGSAALIGETIYLAGGQSGLALESAMTNLWSLDLSMRLSPDEFSWRELEPWPGPSRAFNLVVSQHNGYEHCLYVISGRRQRNSDPENVDFLSDVWEYAPTTQSWRQRADVPNCVMAGTAASFGQSHIFVFGGADGSLFFKGNELRDNHPGFPNRAFAYHTITDTWTSAGTTPINQVTSTAVKWGDSFVIPTGEIRPRVRTPSVYRVTVQPLERGFGILNYIVLFAYLLAMVGIGVYFTRKNRNTDDYFRGGQSIPWWAAGCSIFATMLSSLTFTGIPAKAFAQDWVYAIGNFMIPLVAIVAVYIAMPFFRGINATSAYEYLEKRFSRSVRLFGSASFTLFHVFRMAVVMSLTGLALAVATPITPVQSVLLIGILSIAYCTLGGIEAVIWTDTIQTVVLLGGAILAVALLLTGVEGGVGGFADAAAAGGKLRIANFHWDATATQIALWVIIIGGLAQNLSSYTADQAVVQRYMTTADQKLAARSIWTNAVLSIPATLLFFGIGTALFAYYQSSPSKLDPTISTDQIFPLFIAREMPVGLTGLIVAGIFAAAQSTVSTSMNSTATAIVTDFLRPANFCTTERGYLLTARLSTLLFGIAGTLIGLFFVDPDIKSLFDQFIKVIGLFMGVLGGLFILGALTRRANATGALVGAIVGAGIMFSLWKFTVVNGYLYTAAGITTCLVVGYVASLLSSPETKDLTGLTIYTLKDESIPVGKRNSTSP